MKVNTDYFKPLLEAWLPEHCGPKPSKANLEAALSLPNMGGKGTKRPGHEALFIAMALRANGKGEPIGCTRRQHGVAGDCGPALNYYRWLVSAGYLKGGVVAGGRPMAYTATLTAKGTACVKRVSEAPEADTAAPKADKPVKAKKATKGARKPRRKPADAPVTAEPVSEAPALAPTSEPAQVSETVTE